MASFKRVGRAEIPGGGQVTVQGKYAYVGHIAPPHGTSILDVSDPKNPRVVSSLEVPGHTHSHKVRVHNDTMLINYEQFGRLEPDFQGGMKVFDISDKTKPREIAFFKCDGGGMHRFDYDGDYAYISPQVQGYYGNIVMVVDMKDPREPKEVSRWWMPGQWIAGGEKPTWDKARTRCHHPLRRGNRLYTSYWHGGFVILDVDDLTKPKMLSHVDWSPPFPCPTHTAIPLPKEYGGHRFMVVADEEVQDRLTPTPAAFLWIVDITDETNPVPVSNFRATDGKPYEEATAYGCHQPQEQIDGTMLFVTWFGGGLRGIDVRDPYSPREVAHHMPQLSKGQKNVQSNDVFYDRNTGLIYLLDRLGGLEILEFNA